MKASSFEKFIVLGNIDGKRKRGHQVVRWMGLIKAAINDYSSNQGFIKRSEAPSWKQIILEENLQG